MNFNWSEGGLRGLEMMMSTQVVCMSIFGFSIKKIVSCVLQNCSFFPVSFHVKFENQNLHNIEDERRISITK